MKLDVMIVDQSVSEDPQDGRSYTEYSVKVDFGDQYGSSQSKSWVVQKRYKNFYQLQEQLLRHFQGVQFPQSSSFFNSLNNDRANVSAYPGSGCDDHKKQVTDRKSQLEQYLRDISLIPCIKESNLFKKFLGFD